MQRDAFNGRNAAISSIVALMVVGSHAFADSDEAVGAEETQPIVDELLFTETVQAQEKGELQLTARVISFDNDDEGDTNTVLLGVEYGITDRLQVEAAWAVWNQVKAVEDDERDHTGSGDVEFGVKYAFEEDERTGVRVAIGFDVTIPQGDVDKDLGEGFWVYEPYIVISKNFGASTNLTVNLAYGFLDRDAYPDEIDEAEPDADEIEVNVGLVHAFTPAWRGTLELSLETNEQSSKGDETATYLVPGFVYKGIEGVEIGAGIPVGLTNDSGDWGVIGMLSLEF